MKRGSKHLASIGLAAAAFLSSCTDDAPFRERGKVLRFGPAPNYDRYVEGIRRPLPSSSDAVVRLEVPNTQAGTLWISLRTNVDQASGESCTAKLLDSNGTSIASASVKLERKDVWTENSLPLEGSSGSKTLELTCTRPGIATWSQPYVVPKGKFFAPAQPLIVLLSVDTLRADHVEGFGAPPGATPAMGQLGKEGCYRCPETASIR